MKSTYELLESRGFDEDQIETLLDTIAAADERWLQEHYGYAKDNAVLEPLESRLLDADWRRALRAEADDESALVERLLGDDPSGPTSKPGGSGVSWLKNAADALVSAVVVTAWGATFLVLVEAVVWMTGSVNLERYGSSLPLYFATVFGVTSALFAAQVGPLWMMGWSAGKLRDSIQAGFVLACAGAFGWFWQDTLLHGDGIRANEYFIYWRIGLGILGPVGLMGLVYATIVEQRWPRVRRFVILAVLVTGVIANFTLLKNYKTFQGYLAAFNGLAFIALVFPLRATPIFQRVGVILAAAILLSLPVAIDESRRRNVQSLSHLPSALMAATPPGNLTQVRPDLVIDFDLEFTQGDDRSYQKALEPAEASQVRGRNVILIVLETVRWDMWADPRVAPRFHEWSKAGLYAPNSVAQYPATPLAYGALFASQPPSVLAATSNWASHRIFDGIRERFDSLILTKPDIDWFERTVVTDFFIPRDTPVNQHTDAEEGLSHVREQIETMSENDSFFAWAHLYEPHSPYNRREEYEIDAYPDSMGYVTELRYIDDTLGEFMEWFQDHPMSDETLVILVADHGEGLGETIMGEEFRRHHVHVHNVVTRIPIYVQGPGFEAGQVDPDLRAMQLDVMPTVYDFLGESLDPNHFAQGRSIYELVEQDETRPVVAESFGIRGGQFFDFVRMTGETTDPKALDQRFVHVTTHGFQHTPKVSIEVGELKLVYDRSVQRYWLYDLEEDPYETRDLAAERPEELEAMQAELDAWYRSQSWIVRQLRGLAFE